MILNQIIKKGNKMKQKRPGKRSCKYYETCGNAENCLRCEGYKKMEVKK